MTTDHTQPIQSAAPPSRWREVLGVVIAATACLAPAVALSLPAAGVLLLWLPGWLIVRRVRPSGDAITTHGLAAALSIVLSPVWLALVWRFTIDPLVILGGALVICLVISIAAPPRRAALAAVPTRASRLLLVLLGYVGLIVFGSIWLPEAGGHVGVRAAHDYTKHHAVIFALNRGPLPLTNPFYELERDTPYYYYEYHHYLAAAMVRLTRGHATVGLAFAVSSACVAMAFVAMVFALTRRLAQSDYAGLFGAACTSVVGGWDVVPNAVRALNHVAPPIILDAWMPIPWRVHNLLTQFMWCPQHMAATLALLVAVLLIHHAPRSRWWIILAPLLGASIFGSSVYLAMTFFAAAALYVLHLIWSARREGRRVGRLLLGSAAIAALGLLLMAHQAWEYRIMAQRLDGGLVLEWERFDYAVLGRWLSPGPLANWLDGPWVLLIELGLPGLALLLVGGAAWRKLWRDDGVRLLILAGGLGTAALYTFRSSVSPFDYSFRVAVTPLQVLGAVCAGFLLKRLIECRPAARGKWTLLLIGASLGLPVGLYEGPLMAARTWLRTPRFQADAGAIHFIRDETPSDAVIQGLPGQRLDLLQLVDRQLAVCDPDNSHVRVFYPLDMARMRRVYAEVTNAFTQASSRAAYAALTKAGATHVMYGSIEHGANPSGAPFDDLTLFERIYADELAAVYRLRTPAELASVAGTSQTADRTQQP